MADNVVKKKARRKVEAAQKRFVRETEGARRARRDAFAQAQQEGLTLRDIGEAAGLHHSRVAEIIKAR